MSKFCIIFIAGGSSNRTTEMNFQGLTVERLRAVLKEKGLSPKGRKVSALALATKLVCCFVKN